MCFLWFVTVLRVCCSTTLDDPSSAWLGVGGLRVATNLFARTRLDPRRSGWNAMALVEPGRDEDTSANDEEIRTDVKARPDDMLVTTAYWNIKSKRGNPEESDTVYRSCMANVMTLNTPLVIYGDDKALEEMQNARGAVAPPLVGATKLRIEQLSPCSDHNQMLLADQTYQKKYTNDYDVPSVALGCIWVGKPGLLARSAQDHPGYAWYAWLDVCMGHGEIAFDHSNAPWPNQERLQQLPQNQITVSYSEENSCEDCRGHWRYCHCLAGTAFVVPGTMVEQFAGNFSRKVDECLAAFTGLETGAFVCLSDQVIMTRMLLDNPDLFFVSSSGYGAVVTSYLSNEA